MLAKFSKVLALVVILSGLGVAFNSPSYANENFDDQNSPSSVNEGDDSSSSPGNITFHCDTNGSVPRTVASGGGKNTTVIRWIHKDFSGSGYDPLTRCQQVSARLQRSFNDGTLNYVTAGIVNGMPVICAANPGTGCNPSNTLFTLRRGVNAAVTLQQLFDVRTEAGPALEESSGRSYVNLRKKLAPLVGNRTRNNQPTSNPRSNQRPSSPSQPGRVF